MSKKVLIRKNEGGGVQGFYDIGGQRPSFGQLANRTFRDPTASAWQKIGAGLGMLGKVGAAGVTGIQTAHGLQGGNMGAALQVPQAYAALDPTAGQANAVTPHEQQMEMQRKEAEEQRQKKLAAMNLLGISAKDMHRRGARGQPAQAQPQIPAGMPPQQQAQPVAVSQPVDMRSNKSPSPHPAGNRPPGMPLPTQVGVVDVGGGTLNPNMTPPTQSPAAPPGVPTSAPVGNEVQQPAPTRGPPGPEYSTMFPPAAPQAQPAAQSTMTPQEIAGTLPQAPGMFPQPPAPAPAAPVAPAPAPAPVAQPPAGNNMSIIGGKVTHNGQEVKPNADGQIHMPGMSITSSNGPVEIMGGGKEAVAAHKEAMNQAMAQHFASGGKPGGAAAAMKEAMMQRMGQPPAPAPAPAPAPVAQPPAPAAPVAPAPAPATPAPAAPAPVEQPPAKTAMLRPLNAPEVRPMGGNTWENQSWEPTSAEIQREKEFDARRQEERYQPRELSPSPGARPASTHAGTFIRTVKPIPMDKKDSPVVVKPPVNTGGLGSNAMEDTKIPTLRDNPLFTGSGKDFGVPKGSNQERLNRIASDEAFDSAYGQQEGEAWRRRHGGFRYKSFTQMVFNEFGDMLRKADPHVAGLLAMRIYMDKFMR